MTKKEKLSIVVNSKEVMDTIRLMMALMQDIEAKNYLKATFKQGTEIYTFALIKHTDETSSALEILDKLNEGEININKGCK